MQLHRRSPRAVSVPRSSSASALPHAAGALLLAATAAGQTMWTNLGRLPGPGPLVLAAMAYDVDRHVVVLVGGTDTMFQHQNSAWKWDGSSWHAVAQRNPPPARYGHEMVYDSGRRAFVLFGGRNQQGVTLDDTWEGRWTSPSALQWQQALVTGPPARYLHGMAYHPQRAVTVLFGGSLSNTIHDDTWVWDGSQWRQEAGRSPPARDAMRMVYQDASQTVLMAMGNRGNGQGSYRDTWHWSGSWTRQADFPTAGRHDYSLAYDSARCRAVVFGGLRDPHPTTTDETWEWDGVAWLLQAPANRPVPSYGHAMVFDRTRKRAVLFGGTSSVALGETWLYEGEARYDLFGSGCPGPAGTPVLDALPCSPPWLGEVFTVRVAPLSNSPTIMALGASNRSWMGISLPLPLDFLGRIDCRLLVSLDVTTPMVAFNGVAQWTIQIPNQANLLGGVFYNQALSLSAPMIGIEAVSNGGCGTIGRR